MNWKSRFSIDILKSLIVFGGIFLFTVHGFAEVSNVFKWKDDQGKIHFTDDALKVPSERRFPGGVEKRRVLPAPKPSPFSPSSTASRNKQKEVRAEDAAKTDEEERTVMQEALNFLKSDVQRYKKYENFAPKIRHYRSLKVDITAVLPVKEALEKKLGKNDSALFQDISGFLKKSLQQDYKAVKLYPKSSLFAVERIRIAGESVEKNSLIETLEAELGAGSE